MRRGVQGVVGHVIQLVQRTPCQLRPIQIQPRIDVLNRRVQGRQIVAVGRRGKRVLLHLDDDAVIVIEPRMTGLVLVAQPPNQAHLRVRIALQGERHHEVLFWDRRGLGTFRLLSAEQKEAVLGDRVLGIDALEITAEQLRERLKSSRRAIKVALLDQKAVAGIGNLYAAEILHVAGVDPRTRCDLLSRSQWQRIQAATVEVLSEAIRHEGSTLSDGTYRNALNDAGGYQNHHRVYDREGQPCPRCGQQPIRRIVQAQRSTFFCSGCQRKRGTHPAAAPNVAAPNEVDLDN